MKNEKSIIKMVELNDNEKGLIKLYSMSAEEIQKKIGNPHVELGKLILIQPNSVTNARYEYTTVQQNVLICLMGALQKYMNKDHSEIYFDLFNSPYVRIDTDIVQYGERHKNYVWEQIIEMSKKRFDFAYTNDSGKDENINTSLIGSIRNVTNSKFIDVELSKWAIPYLVYYGKGVGGTVYNRNIALLLRGTYSKRLYLLCKRWEDEGGFSISHDKFLSTLEIGNKYPYIALLKTKILDPAKKEIREKSDIGFEYQFYKNKAGEINIAFKVFGAHNKKEDYDFFSFVYSHLNLVFPYIRSSKALDVTEKLMQTGVIREAYDKFQRLRQELSEKRKTEDDVINITLHILQTDFNIDTGNVETIKKKKKPKKEPENKGQFQLNLPVTISPHWKNRDSY